MNTGTDTSEIQGVTPKYEQYAYFWPESTYYWVFCSKTAGSLAVLTIPGANLARVFRRTRARPHTLRVQPPRSRCVTIPTTSVALSPTRCSEPDDILLEGLRELTLCSRTVYPRLSRSLLRPWCSSARHTTSTKTRTRPWYPPPESITCSNTGAQNLGVATHKSDTCTEWGRRGGGLLLGIC